MAGDGEQRDPGSARAPGDDRRCHVEVRQQARQSVGLHRRLGRALEADIGGAAVRTVPDQDSVAAFGDRLRQLAHTGRVLAETAARRDRPRPAALTDHLVFEGKPLDHCPRHEVTLPLETMPGTQLLADTFIVDADSHWCEQPDWFTSLAPPEYKERVPRVEDVDGTPMWVFDGHPVGRYSAGGVIGRDGSKEEADIALHQWSHEQIHVGAWDPKVRLQVLDECGIDAQVIFPSTIGLGGQDLALVDDDALRRLTVHMYNDRMAQIQDESNNRLLPLPLMPAWNIDYCVAEAQRVAALGARGINMTSDPQDLGAPDLADPAWDPFWDTCAGL